MSATPSVMKNVYGTFRRHAVHDENSFFTFGHFVNNGLFALSHMGLHLKWRQSGQSGYRARADNNANRLSRSSKELGNLSII